MSRPENFGGYDTESVVDPELAAVAEFLEIYNKIMALLAWLAEVGAGADPVLRGVRGGQMQQLLQRLGIDPESPSAIAELDSIKYDITSRVRHPQPRIDIPEAAFFNERIEALITEQETQGPPPAYHYATQDVADIVDVAQYGHTDWSNVLSRRGSDHNVSEWIRGIATIMADPIAYQTEFGGLGIDLVRQAPDPLTIEPDWAIWNGRHRSLAVRSLGGSFVLDAGMRNWVAVNVEQP